MQSRLDCESTGAGGLEDLSTLIPLENVPGPTIEVLKFAHKGSWNASLMLVPGHRCRCLSEGLNWPDDQNLAPFSTLLAMHLIRPVQPKGHGQ